MPILILDTETTGLDETSRLVQLAYKNLDTGETVNEYFKPPVAISFGAMATHHVTNEMVADKPAFADSAVKSELAKALAGSVLVAHNALFDIGILKNEGVAVGEYIDTLRVIKHLATCERYDLQYLRYFLNLNIETATAHDALGDILILEKLFGHLRQLVKEKLSLETDGEIIAKMIELTKTPVLLNKISFGKYKGKTFAEINQTDPGYLSWLYNSESSKKLPEQNEELIYTLKKHLYIDKT